MPKKHSESSSRSFRRDDAEQRLRPGGDPGPRSHEELSHLYHDLEVHQVELEIQNAELQRVQQELVASEDKYRDLYEFGPIGHFVMDPWGRIRELNLAGASVLGETRSAILQQPFQVFLMGGCLSDFNSFCEQVMHSKVKIRAEFQLQPPGGHGVPFWILMEARRLDCEKEPGFRAAIIDISEQKRVEGRLKETSEYLESLIRYANVAIIVWDPDHRITRFNAAFEHLTGYMAWEVLGKPVSLLFPPEARTSALFHIQRSAGGEYWEAVEIPILCKDGDVRIVLWNSANIYASDTTRVTATIAQGQDITERIHAEKDLRDYAKQLKRSNEDLERFAFIASHDLQEPLRNVISFSQLLSRRYYGRLNPDADEYIDYIVEGGKRMQALVSDLLEYSRVTTRPEAFRSTDSSEVLDTILQNLFSTIQGSGAVIESTPLPVIHADPAQLGMVFQNLITNAIKFHGPEPPHIHISAERVVDGWKFSVRDNGIGIDPAFYDRIFVIFQRLHTRDRYPGTGVGLAIVKKIIERHGGRIWVESEVGKGSTFYFTLWEHPPRKTIIS
jgi:chemotaxis family two-component system sensor kinase Cph1